MELPRHHGSASLGLLAGSVNGGHVGDDGVLPGSCHVTDPARLHLFENNGEDGDYWPGMKSR